MKKSTNEAYKIPLLWEMFTMEGGLSLLIIFPLIVLFFLRMAYESV